MVQGADGRIHFLYCVGYGVRGGGVYRVLRQLRARVRAEKRRLKRVCRQPEKRSIRRVIDGGRGGYVETAVDAIRDRIYVLYEHDFGKAVYLAVTRYDE